MGLSDGERISMIRSAVLIQYTRVTDGRTDGQTDGIGVAYTRYSIYAVARKNQSIMRVFPVFTEDLFQGRCRWCRRWWWSSEVSQALSFKLTTKLTIYQCYFSLTILYCSS